MNLEEFEIELNSKKLGDDILDFCRKHVLHGTPFIFNDRDDLFYDFRKRIAVKFDISFHEVYITGSAKLGFSIFKKKNFDLDSDIDVALISPLLFESIMKDVAAYQMQFRNNRAVVRESALIIYHEFLEYVALGWIRPDKLPISFQMNTFKNDWFDFFRDISNGKSEVGNYKVAAGVFKSYEHLEDYIVDGLNNIKKSFYLNRRK